MRIVRSTRTIEVLSHLLSRGHFSEQEFVEAVSRFNMRKPRDEPALTYGMVNKARSTWCDSYIDEYGVRLWRTKLDRNDAKKRPHLR
jgi:hypothetical protein